MKTQKTLKPFCVAVWTLNILCIFLFLAVSHPTEVFAKNRNRSNKVGQKVIEKIFFRGQRKIEEAAVRSKLISKEGKAFSQEQIREDVKALFDTGYFFDIQVDKVVSAGKIHLTYILTEKPSVAEITYEGNEEIDDEELAETTEFKVYEILDLNKVAEATEKIEKLYEDKGFFLAQVKIQPEEIKKGETVRLKVIVTENDKVQVKRIRFLGNKQLSTVKLKSMMETKEGGFFSFMTSSGAYKQDAFDRDVQRLSFIYFNEGFVQVKIDPPQVYVSADKKSLFITIQISEGEKFYVGDVSFSGDLMFSTEELEQGLKIKEKELFAYGVLQKDLSTLTAKYGDLGYAFTNVIPRTRIKAKERIVDITFEIDKGNKVYIGQLNVKGNSRTRDKVVRRELKILEGELFHETRKRESLANIKRLGFFEEVNLHTNTPEDQKDKLNIDFVVKERNTGTIQVGAGYSSFNGLVINGQVNQTNFLGRGQKLGVSINYSKKESLFNLSFTEPYFLDTEWSVGGDVYQRNKQLSEYSETKLGGAARLGHPLAPYLRGVVGYKFDDTNLKLTSSGDPDLFPVDTANGITSSLTSSLVYDRRDDRFAPTDGVYANISLEYAGLGGDLKYTKGLASFRYYKELFWNIVWRNNVNYGVVSPNGSDRDVPFNQLFLLGGANSLRGFDWFTIGRRKYSEKAFNQAAGDPNAGTIALRPFGGTQQFYYNLEFQFPLIEEAKIKGVIFYDIGNADDSLIIDELRSDVGFGFRWYSPIGPLRFEWGFPLERKKEFNERAMNFQFAIGAPF